MRHQSHCMTHDDPVAFMCTCTPLSEEEQDRMIEAASIRSPAELLREAKAKGWAKPVPAYGFE